MLEEDKEKQTARNRRIAALVSFFPAYLYVRGIWVESHPTAAVCMMIFTALLIVCTEVCADRTGRPLRRLRAENEATFRESVFVSVCALLQALGVLLWRDGLGWQQYFLWHFTLIYYVLCRANLLAAGRTGVLFPIDACAGLFAPWADIFLRFRCLYLGGRAEQAADSRMNTEPPVIAGDEESVWEEDSSDAASLRMMKHGIRVLTALIALVLCTIAWRELAQVSDTFARINLWAGARRLFSADFFRMLRREFLPYFLLSIPVGAWLFGLVAGSMKREKPVCSDRAFFEATAPMHVFPESSALVIIGCLSAVYLLFFASALIDLSQSVRSGLFYEKLRAVVSAHDASVYAVNGFWQLVRVVILNFSVLLGLMLFLKKPLWESRRSRAAVTLLFLFAAMFALLAGWKLFALYIGLYGPTPRRILSGWVLTMLLLWCVLALIRFHKRIPAARIGILTAAATWTILCLLPIGAICDHAAAGTGTQSTAVVSEIDKTELRDPAERTATSAATSVSADSASSTEATDDARERIATDMPEEVFAGYRAIYEQCFQPVDDFDFREAYGAKGNSYVILKRGAESVEYLTYDRESKNGRCGLYVYYRCPREADGSWSPADAAILDVYAHVRETGEVIASGRRAWADVGSDAYREATGE